MNYRFHPAAEAEHLEQIVFYESRQQGLGSRYRTHFLRTIERICEAPAQYAVEQPPDIRRSRLRLFPPAVLYREQNGVILNDDRFYAALRMSASVLRDVPQPGL
jgi:toxin ParE1/3/4